MSRFKIFFIGFGVLSLLVNISSGQEKNGDSSQEKKDKGQAEIKNIVIADEPKTIDPATMVYDPLSKKVSIEFNEISVREVVQWIREASGMTVLVNESELSDENIRSSEPVTDRLRNEPLYLLLNRLRSISLGWYVEDDILHITTRASAAEHLSTISHNVGKFFDQEFDPDKLTDSILNGTDAQTWEDSGGGPGTLILLGDVLFIRQSEEMHRQVSGLLMALETHGRRTFIDDPPEHEALRGKLKTKLSVEFKDTPLSEAVKELANKSEADIRIDTVSFRDEGFHEREPVSLKLADQKLLSVLQALTAKLKLTWTLRNGYILVTTEQTAQELVKTAVFDVRDLSRNDDEAHALADAIQTQTDSNAWLDTSGGPGTISFAKPGVMVIRNTEKILGEVLNQLDNYRQALKISKVRNRNQIDPKERVTEYYRMPKVIADDLEELLQSLVESQSWKTDANPQGFGSIVKVASTPSVIGSFNGVLTQKTGKENVATNGGLAMDYSVLIIYQSRETHDKIRDLIFKIEHGNIEQQEDTGGGMGGGMGGSSRGRGGFGGGLFSVPGKPKKSVGKKTKN